VLGPEVLRRQRPDAPCVYALGEELALALFEARIDFL
jgi:hypothetical protein